ncbi:MAG: hypothetical protein BGN83_19805 [Rhizobium sp. 63-7]|nr:MAG: hypothetical protein BGN83_19805 [Rhizobium sp. 63-7]
MDTIRQAFCSAYGDLLQMCRPSGLTLDAMFTPDNFMLFVSTLLGAVVGGMITLVANLWSSSRHKREADKTALTGVMIKVGTIRSDVIATREAIERCLARSNDHGLTHLQLWQRIEPIIGSRTSAHIDTAELTAIVEAREFVLMGNIMTLTMKANIFFEALDLYSRFKMEMEDLIPDTEAAETGVLFSRAPLKGPTAAKAMKLESLITAIRKQEPEIMALCETIIRDLPIAAQKHFKTKRFLMIAPASETDEA